MSQAKPSTSAPHFQWSFLLPQYWGIWLVILVFLFLSILPWTVQRYIAYALASIAWKILKSRRQTTIRNLELCFPEWSAEDVQRQGKQVFVDMMLGVFETLKSWFHKNWFDGRVSIEGLEALQAAQKDGHGVILLGSHSTLLDAGGYICSRFFAVDVMYRPQNNPIFEWFFCTARQATYGELISSRNTPRLVERLKTGHIAWYSPDQDFGLKQGVMADFFGVPAATVIAQRRLARETHAKVLSIQFYRIGEKDPKYQIIIEPELENYPTEDAISDATRVNQLLEMQIRRAPTQWMWFHKRFKTRPEGYEKIY
ncbi:MAG: lauroyl acyltransferase [Acinetobacter sp.]|jgi:KDO2-lipid IV(A) lauroyltransferase|nr:MAG: lauroyl acyltransferase [Acinetobacter sp.]